jgi:hypothetical protein
MDAAKSVTANFGLIPRNAQLDATPYVSLSSAYLAATNPSNLLLHALEYNEGLVMDSGVDITLKGGYDADFINTLGTPTTLNQPIHIKSGRLNVRSINVSPLSPTVTVPDVVGKSQADASIAIIYQGLITGAVSNTNSSIIGAGSIVSQDPAASVSATRGSAVNLVVSSGPAP